MEKIINTRNVVEEDKFDVVVVGGGIMGSCTAYQISKRGFSTLLLDQFDMLHSRGSSHGESRGLRATYPESYYTSMVLESSKLWEEGQSEIGYKVLYPTKQLDIGPSSHLSLQAVIRSCEFNSIKHWVLDPAEVAREGMTVPEDWIGVISEGAGVIKATKAVSMFQTLAFRNGAILKDNSKAIDISKENCGGIRIVLETGECFYGRKCVITAGAWMNKLVKKVTGCEIPIQPLETAFCYWKIKEEHERDYSLDGGFPSFAGYGDPYIYGTPSFEYPGMIKVAVHGGQTCDPDKRTWTHDSELMDLLRNWVMDRFGGQVEDDGPVLCQSCMYSMTPDEDYVIDFLGGDFGKDVVIAGGFSGHGFKMGPLIGRVTADLVLHGKAEGVKLEYFKLERFDKNPNGNVKNLGVEQIDIAKAE